MPNFLISLSEPCYKEFQNVKQQLNINLDLWSDSDILKMIFEKIGLNKDILKEIKTIGKSCKGRTLPPKYLHHINMDNIETLSQCPSCDYNICMLDYSMKEIARIEMFSHFDSTHDKAGHFQCTCNRIFDWMPAYLRHKSMCEHPFENTTQSLIENSLESRPLSKKQKFELQNDTISTDIDNNIQSLYTCNLCSLSFSNSSLYLNHICLTETRYNSPPFVKDIQPIMSTPAQLSTQRFTSSHTVPNGIDFLQSMPLNLSMNSAITLICHCGDVFNEFLSYHSHNISCKNNSQQEISTDRLDDFQRCPSPLKLSLKDIQPNSEGRYQCPCCSKSFSSILSLKQHYSGMHSTTYVPNATNHSDGSRHTNIISKHVECQNDAK